MTTPLKVLYVDDEPELLEIGKIFLERGGDYSVTTCEGAGEAMKRISGEAFDVIVSDYMMPECDGIRFLKYLRKHGEETPFIIFTGKGREEVVIEAFENGADFYIQKGGDPRAQFAELRKKIEYAASRRRSERALRESEAYYRTIFANTGTASAILEADTTISLVNDEFANLCGYSHAEIEGKMSWTDFVGDRDRQKMLE
ncbi:MAG TPA: response regulator, partial [Methanoregulaceae archaeon]|nr:response regulator [Methanoregulaceae archaeon]